MKADALVLLGCRITPDGRPGSAGTRRCAALVQAYHEGVAPWVLVSGGRQWHGVSEAEAMTAELERSGVPREAISTESASETTFENAWFSAALLAARGARSVALVTCDYHARRARRQFQRMDFRVEVVPAPTPGLTPLRRHRLALRELGSLALQAPLGVLWEL